MKSLFLRDRLLRGGLAGIIASLWILSWNLFSYFILRFGKTTWSDALSQLVLGHIVKGTMDFLVAIVLNFIWNGFLGAIYVQFIMPKRDGNYLGRALGFSYVAWFILLSVGTLYKVKALHQATWQTAMSNWVAVAGFGIILGWLTKRWDEVEK